MEVYQSMNMENQIMVFFKGEDCVVKRMDLGVKLFCLKFGIVF